MAVGLQLATKNSFVRVQEDINDNLTKLDEAIDFNLLATLGIEYGGILNNTNAKTSGKAYYDTTGKKLYKCIANTSVNYADAGYFVVISNNDLLGKLNNLTKQINYYTATISGSPRAIAKVIETALLYHIFIDNNHDYPIQKGYAWVFPVNLPEANFIFSSNAPSSSVSYGGSARIHIDSSNEIKITNNISAWSTAYACIPKII